MRAPDFWARAPAAPLARALAPLGALYGAAASARMARRGARADLPTIVVGGLTLGGDGKTPTVLALASLLAEMGERPAILSRGYGRRDATRAPFVVDAARHTAREAGDEALLLSGRATTIVGADRVAGARLAHALGATALLLDDGLQSRRLEPDLAFAVIDCSYGAGNGLCFPAGPLRAPLSHQLEAVDVVVAIGAGGPGEAVVDLAARAGKTVFRACIEPTEAAPSLAGRRVLAFAGIARPEKLAATLGRIGADVAGLRRFPDHHRYTERELSALAGEARRIGATLVATEKDATRLSRTALAEFTVLPIALVFDAPEAVRATLRGVTRGT
jgi:tetraacyldisaccharide 4'-kinase